MAVVCTEAESEPASGSVRAKEVTISPVASRAAIGLLFVRAEHDQALAADADIGAEGRAEGGRGAAQLDRDQRLVLHGKAQAAVFLGDGEAEEAQLAHLGDDASGTRLLGHLGLDRPQALGDEAADGLDQLIAGFDVERHVSLLGSRETSPSRAEVQAWLQGCALGT